MAFLCSRFPQCLRSLAVGRIDALRPIQVDELLAETRYRQIPASGASIKDASVCVTGAGGLIGSNLSSILALKPRRLVLLEHSESSLYTIHQELNDPLSIAVDIVPILGSVANAALVERCLEI